MTKIIAWMDHMIEADNTKDIVKNANKKVESFFKKGPKEIEIKIVYSRKDFDQFFKMASEKWEIGRTGVFNNEPAIVILSPQVIESESSHKKEDFKATLTHELVHAYHLRFINSNCKKWFSEGLAVFLSGQHEGKEAKVISDIPKIINSEDWAAKGHPYTLSGLFVEYLAQKNGLKKLQEFAKSFENKKSFEENFEKIFGKKEEDLFLEFKKEKNIITSKQ